MPTGLKIPKNIVEKAYLAWLEHPDWKWDQIGEASGMNPSTARHRLKVDYGVSLYTERPVQGESNGVEVVAFYLKCRNKMQTARRFNVTPYQLAEIFIHAGRKELAAPSYAKMVESRIRTQTGHGLAQPQPNEVPKGNGSILRQIWDEMIRYEAAVALVEEMRDENAMLNRKLAEQVEINTKLQEKIVRAQAVFGD